MYPRPLRRHSFVVLDQNRARDRSIVSKLIADFDGGGPGILLPWVVWREYTKSEKPFEPTIAALSELSARPEAVSIATPAQIIRAKEHAFQRAAEEVVDARHSAMIRALLRSIRGGGPGLDKYETLVNQQKEWASGISDLTRWETGLRGLTLDAKRSVAKDDSRRLLDALTAGDRKPFREYLAKHFGRERLLALLTSKEIGYGYRRAERLTRAPTMAPLIILAVAQAGLLWHLWKGIDTQSADDLEREGNDIEYALIAVRCGDYVTKDAEARERYEDLLEVSRIIW